MSICGSSNWGSAGVSLLVCCCWCVVAGVSSSENFHCKMIFVENIFVRFLCTKIFYVYENIFTTKK